MPSSRVSTSGWLAVSATSTALSSMTTELALAIGGFIRRPLCTKLRRMTRQPIRIAILNFAHETVTFLPNDTTYEDFIHQGSPARGAAGTLPPADRLFEAATEHRRRNCAEHFVMMP